MVKFKYPKVLKLCACVLIVTVIATNVTGSTDDEKIVDIRSNLNKAIGETMDIFNSQLWMADGMEICPFITESSTADHKTAILQEICDNPLEFDLEDMKETYGIAIESDLPIKGEITFFPDTATFTSSQDAKVDVHHGSLSYAASADNKTSPVSPMKLTAGVTMGLNMVGFQLDYYLDIVLEKDDIPVPIKARGSANFFIENPLVSLNLNLFMNEKYISLDTNDYLFKFETGQFSFYLTGFQSAEGSPLDSERTKRLNVLLNELFQKSIVYPSKLTVEQALREYTTLDSSNPSELEKIIYSALLGQGNTLLAGLRVSPSDLIQQLEQFGNFVYSEDKDQKDSLEEALKNNFGKEQIEIPDDEPDFFKDANFERDGFGRTVVNLLMGKYNKRTVCYINKMAGCENPEFSAMNWMDVHKLAKSFGSTLPSFIKGRIALRKSSTVISFRSKSQDTTELSYKDDELIKTRSKRMFVVPHIGLSVEYEMDIVAIVPLTAKGRLVLDFNYILVTSQSQQQPNIPDETFIQIYDVQLHFGGLEGIDAGQVEQVSKSLNDAILGTRQSSNYDKSLKKNLISWMEAMIVEFMRR